MTLVKTSSWEKTIGKNYKRKRLIDKTFKKCNTVTSKQ